MEDYINLRLEEFLDSITNKKAKYQLTFYGAKSNVQGDLSEIYEQVKNFNDFELRQSVLGKLKDKKEYVIEFELNNIEIYNYLEKHTSNFDRNKTKLILSDIEVYYSMDFKERIEEESKNIYNQNEWEIPTLKHFSPILNEEVVSPDYDTMIKKTHPFDSMAILGVIELLKDKLSEKQEKEETKKTNKIPHNNIFKEVKHFELFEYLHNQISKNELAEYSFIYWSMIRDKLIYENIKPTDFINWLNKYYDISLIELKQFYRVNTGSKPSNYQTAKLLFNC